MILSQGKGAITEVEEAMAAAAVEKARVEVEEEEKVVEGEGDRRVSMMESLLCWLLLPLLGQFTARETAGEL